MHPLDMPVYTHAADVAEMYQLQFEEPALPDRVLAEGDTLSVGTLSFRVMHLPVMHLVTWRSSETASRR